MKRYILTLLILAVALGATSLPAPSPGDLPVRVFHDLEGTWEGTFVGYAEDGKELYRIAVKQTYRTVTDTTQMVEITDRMYDGTTISGKGQNIAKRRPDGTLELICMVKKTNGDRVQHAGRLVKDHEGNDQIIWHSSDVNRTETFREHVYRDAEGRVIYEINGMGRYGTTMMLMHGRYVKQSADLPALPNQLR